MRRFVIALVALGMFTAPALAAPCKDAKGKFTKCPDPKPVAKPTQCRDAKGKFAKCPTAAPPAKPVQCKDAKGKFAKCGTPGAKPVK